MPMLPTIIRWKRRRLGPYLERYRSPLIRAAFEAVAGDKRVSALVLVMVLGWRSRANTGYVVGGSRAFSEAILARYTGLGGVLRFNARVEDVTVENGRATGVRLHTGENRPASTVVSCADGRTTLLKMLQGRHLSKRLATSYANGGVFPGLLQVSLGINQSFPNAPHSLNLPLTTPLDLQDAPPSTNQLTCSTRHHRLEVAVFGPECELCPSGKTIMIVRLTTHYDFWSDLKQGHPAEYAKAKQRVLGQVVSILDRSFPGVARNLEASDVATPATFERYTANWRGSIQGWLPTPEVLGRRFPRTLRGLDNFYMAGHWVELGGGLPPAALSGRYVAQMLCTRDGKTFVTSTPR
jgi:phytoene dehydrogenase-like protein